MPPGQLGTVSPPHRLILGAAFTVRVIVGVVQAPYVTVKVNGDPEEAAVPVIAPDDELIASPAEANPLLALHVPVEQLVSLKLPNPLV